MLDMKVLIIDRNFRINHLKGIETGWFKTPNVNYFKCFIPVIHDNEMICKYCPFDHCIEDDVIIQQPFKHYDEVIRLFKKGTGLREISRQLHITMNSVIKYVRLYTDKGENYEPKRSNGKIPNDRRSGTKRPEIQKNAAFAN